MAHASRLDHNKQNVHLLVIVIQISVQEWVGADRTHGNQMAEGEDAARCGGVQMELDKIFQILRHRYKIGLDMIDRLDDTPQAN